MPSHLRLDTSRAALDLDLIHHQDSNSGQEYTLERSQTYVTKFVMPKKKRQMRISVACKAIVRGV